MAHQVMMQNERMELKKWARFLGTDADAYDENLEEQDPEGVGSIFPLGAFINPDAFKQLRESGGGQATHTSEVPEEEYERQIKEMESSGVLTEIDMLSDLAAKQQRAKMDNVVLGPEKEIIERQNVPESPPANVRRRKPFRRMNPTEEKSE